MEGSSPNDTSFRLGGRKSIQGVPGQCHETSVDYQCLQLTYLLQVENMERIRIPLIVPKTLFFRKLVVIICNTNQNENDVRT